MLAEACLREGALALAGDQRSDDRDLPQRRAAFRISIEIPVWIEYPVERDCEVIDISVLGARLNVRLPVDLGAVCEFLLITEDFGTIPISAEVVRAMDGETAVRFVGIPYTAARAVKDMIVGEQRRRLLRRSQV